MEKTVKRDARKHQVHKRSPESGWPVSSTFSRASLGKARSNCFYPIVIFQIRFGLAPVQPGPGDHIEQRWCVANVATLSEISPEQRLHNGVLHAFLVGKPDEPAAVEGAGRPLDLVEGERAALGPAYLRHSGIAGQRLFPAPEPGAAVLVTIH